MTNNIQIKKYKDVLYKEAKNQQTPTYNNKPETIIEKIKTENIINPTEMIKNIRERKFEIHYHLDTPIKETLTNDEIEEINYSITEAVGRSKMGSGESVAAAAIALIEGLDKYDITLPYYYGGEHGNIHYGIDEKFGEQVKGKGKEVIRYYYGMDCTGLIMWAIKNAGIELHSPYLQDKNGNPTDPEDMSTTAFLYLTRDDNDIPEKARPEIKEDFSEAKSGDILIKNEHARLVLDTYKDKNGETILICAESTPSEYGTNGKSVIPNGETPYPPYKGGVHIEEYKESEIKKYSDDEEGKDGYRVIDMENYYHYYSPIYSK